MCDCNENRPAFYDEKLVAARGRHECCECRLAILPGAKYWRCTGKWDGGVESFCVCESCKDGMSIVSQATGCCACFTELEQELIYLGRELGTYEPNVSGASQA